MVTPRRSITEKRWLRSFTITFLAIAAAVLFIARSVRGDRENRRSSM